MAGKVWEFFGYRSDDHSATAIAAALSASGLTAEELAQLRELLREDAL